LIQAYLTGTTLLYEKDAAMSSTFLTDGIESIDKQWHKFLRALVNQITAFSGYTESAKRRKFLS